MSILTIYKQTKRVICIFRPNLNMKTQMEIQNRNRLKHLRLTTNIVTLIQVVKKKIIFEILQL